MSHIFKIGDRVRIVGFYRTPTFVGKEATITDLIARPKGTIAWDGAVYCGATDCTVTVEGRIRAMPFCHLEPLNPPKSQIDEILVMKDLPDFEITRVAV